MSVNFSKIKESIEDSQISASDKVKLIALFSRASDSELESVTGLLSGDSSWIEKINQNYKAKQIAMDTGNTDAWKQIVGEEEKQLKEIEGE